MVLVAQIAGSPDKCVVCSTNGKTHIYTESLQVRDARYCRRRSGPLEPALGRRVLLHCRGRRSGLPPRGGGVRRTVVTQGSRRSGREQAHLPAYVRLGDAR